MKDGKMIELKAGEQCPYCNDGSKIRDAGAPIGLYCEAGNKCKMPWPIVEKEKPHAPKNIIFLDIDGVLTSHRIYEGMDEKAGFSGVWRQFDPVAVNFLNRLSREHSCELVLSSTWRRRSFGDINVSLPFILAGGGLRIPPADVWVTDYLPLRKRSSEIADWIDENGLDNFIIFDDDLDAGYGFEDNFVHTDGRNGLLHQHMVRANEIVAKWEKE